MVGLRRVRYMRVGDGRVANRHGEGMCQLGMEGQCMTNWDMKPGNV